MSSARCPPVRISNLDPAWLSITGSSLLTQAIVPSGEGRPFAGRRCCPARSVGCGGVTPEERWLATMWPFVRGGLPAPPAAVVEIGCGPLGGFVPMLRSAGYDASGVDPEAPEGPWYHRVEFERHDLAGPAAAVVACTSLHHVADVGEVLSRAMSALAGGGTLVVVEWA